MSIDIRTLIIAASLTNFLMILIIFLQYRMNKSYSGIGFWLSGLISVAFGTAFLLLRDFAAIELLSIILSNSLIIIGIATTNVGIMRFIDLKENRIFLLSITPVSIISIAYFTFFDNNLRLRIIIVSAVMAILFFQIAIVLFLKKTHAIKASANFIAFLLFISCCFFAFRTAVTFADYSARSFFTPTLMQTATFIFIFSQGLLFAFGLIIMVNQRLNFESGESRENLEHIFNTSPNAVLITRLTDGYYVNVNDGFTAFSGYTREEVIGKTMREVSIWNNFNERQNIIDILLKNGFCENLEFTFRRKDGSRFTAMVSARVINIHGIQHIISVASDISERKDMEGKMLMALQESDILRQKEKEANEAKSVFLANMSHEIRTPMNAIIGMTDLALMTDNEDEQQGYLEAVKDSGKHLLNVINDILDFSKIESGKLLLEQHDFHLKNVFYSVQKIYSIEIKKKGLYFGLEISDEIPNLISADELRIRQILINLISNSMKFTEKGGITIRVCVNKEMKVDSGYTAIEVSVSDTGCGIPPDKQEIIFSKFQQSDMSTSRKYGGTGLGLSIVKELLALMNGDIKVKSEPGKGSEFIFRIIVKISESIHDDNSDRISESHAKPRRKMLNILLAEDNETNILLASTVLKKLGNAVTVARNGIEVIENLKNSNFDLVLMDIEMPEMDGIEATKRIRNGECGIDKSSIFIIAMTAHAIADIKQKGMDAGMNDYITKPIDITKLQERIDMQIYSKPAP